MLFRLRWQLLEAEDATKPNVFGIFVGQTFAGIKRLHYPSGELWPLAAIVADARVMMPGCGLVRIDDKRNAIALHLRNLVVRGRSLNRAAELPRDLRCPIDFTLPWEGPFFHFPVSCRCC
jgi:hypothetical protein